MAYIGSIEELKADVKKLEDYLGWRVHYSSDLMPERQPERWLMEYLYLLKLRYYRRILRSRRKKISKKIRKK
ncbi:MAG: hypothetical protein WC254_03545 [Candidatus Woesearchaeota archaeon]|jgi:hypothetical protein